MAHSTALHVLKCNSSCSTFFRKVSLPALTPTVVLVTHDPREAVLLGNDIYIMDADPGRIIKHIKPDLPGSSRQVYKERTAFHRNRVLHRGRDGGYYPVEIGGAELRIPDRSLYTLYSIAMVRCIAPLPMTKRTQSFAVFICNPGSFLSTIIIKHIQNNYG